MYPWRTAWIFIWTNTQEHFVPNLVEIGPVILDKKIFTFLHTWYIFVFLLFSPFRKGHSPETLYLNKLESTSCKDNLYQVWLAWAQWFWRRWFFVVFNNIIISLFLYYFPLETPKPLYQLWAFCLSRQLGCQNTQY